MPIVDIEKHEGYLGGLVLPELMPGVLTKVIKQPSDFPAAVAGVITLADETYYEIRGFVNLGTDRIDMGGSAGIGGRNRYFDSILTNNAGALFTGDSYFLVRSLTVSNFSGAIFDYAGSNATYFQFLDVFVYGCNTIGLIDSVNTAIIQNCFMVLAVTSGITFAGDGRHILLDTIDTDGIGGTTIDFGESDWDFIQIVNGTVNVVGGQTFISGAAVPGDNVNVAGTLTNTIFTGVGVPATNISRCDPGWEFNGNIGHEDLQDTKPGIIIKDPDNTAETTITVAGTPVQINATWVVETDSDCKMSADGAGTITYDGDVARRFTLMANCVIVPVTGTNIEMHAMFAKNGTAIPDSASSSVATASGHGSTTVVWGLTLAPGDTISLWATNEDTTSNVIASHLKLVALAV